LDVIQWRFLPPLQTFFEMFDLQDVSLLAVRIVFLGGVVLELDELQ